jgi:hypothetical protein
LTGSRFGAKNDLKTAACLVLPLYPSPLVGFFAVGGGSEISYLMIISLTKRSEIYGDK